jgi:hypothetical protein
MTLFRRKRVVADCVSFKKVMSQFRLNAEHRTIEAKESSAWKGNNIN